MVPELPEQLALKEWPEGISADPGYGWGGIRDLLTTEEPPSAASVTPRGRRVADREVPRRRSGSTGSQRSYCGAVEGLGGPLAASWVLAGQYSGLLLTFVFCYCTRVSLGLEGR